MRFDVPAEGRKGPVPNRWEPIPIGKSILRRNGDDLTIVSVGLGVHQSLEAAQTLEAERISIGVLDLRSVSPLDKTGICDAVAATGRLLVVDEDYEAFGLSGEVLAVVAEAGIACLFARVCTQTTIPYARDREAETLPNTRRIRKAVMTLLEKKP